MRLLCNDAENILAEIEYHKDRIVKLERDLREIRNKEQANDRQCVKSRLYDNRQDIS